MTTHTETLKTNSLFRLDGRVVWLTGAAGHLGSVMARGLCEAGAQVILTGRTVEKLEALAGELTGNGFKATPYACDLADEKKLTETIRRIETAFGCIDVLVNNAYNGTALKMEADTVENFDRAYHLAVTTPFRTTQLCTPMLAKAGRKNPGGASVINIGSMYGLVSPDPSIYGDSGQNNPPHYGAAKAGLTQLSRYLACHLADKKIRVNTLSPGAFPQSKPLESNPEFHKALCGKNPMKRVGQPDELIGPLLFLASDASSYVTGTTLVVDGGWTAW